MDRRSNVSGALLVLAAGVLWGTVGPAQVLAGSDAGPVAIGGARIFSGGVILAVLVLVTDRRAFLTLGRRAWGPVVAATAATGIFQAAFFSAVDRTGAAVATAVVFGLAPVSTGLCERLVLETRLSRRWWAGTACAVGGVALLMVPGSAVHVDPAGIGLSLMGGTCFGVYTVSAKVLTGRDAGMAAAVSVTLLAGGAALLPWTLAELPALAEPRSAVLVAWLGIAATAAATCSSSPDSAGWRPRPPGRSASPSRWSRRCSRSPSSASGCRCRSRPGRCSCWAGCSSSPPRRGRGRPDMMART